MAAPSAEKISIILAIAGRTYPLRVLPQEEESVRRLGQEINKRFNEFQVNYRDRDEKDWLVMTLLTYAVDLSTARRQADTGSGGELATRLAALNDLVEGLL